MAERDTVSCELIDLGNLIIDSGGALSWEIADGCRCLCCREFQLRDQDGKLIASGETLDQLLRDSI